MQSVIIGAMQASEDDVLVSIDVEHCECSLELWERQVQGIVLDILARSLESIQEYADFPKVAKDLSTTLFR